MDGPYSWDLACRIAKIMNVKSDLGGERGGSRLLQAADGSAADTCGYLAATEREAENTARALIDAFTATPTTGKSASTFVGKCLVKLRAALRTIEELQRRYPENAEIPVAVERLRKAIRMTELHGARSSSKRLENNL